MPGYDMIETRFLSNEECQRFLKTTRSNLQQLKEKIAEKKAKHEKEIEALSSQSNSFKNEISLTGERISEAKKKKVRKIKILFLFFLKEKLSIFRVKILV